MRTLTLLSLLLCAQWGFGQAPTLLNDIVPGTDGSSPNNMFVYQGEIYFGADVDSVGRELWKTDGTSAGTQLVADLRPGSANSSPNFFFVLKDTLYFSANTGSGNVLFKTDGTEAGTQQISTDFVFRATNVGDSLIYFVYTTLGNTLYTFDGTNIDPAPNNGAGTEAIIGANYIQYGDKFLLYMDYSPDEPTIGRELYEYDLATGLYTLVKDIDTGTGDASISEFTQLGGLVYFEADNDLWVTDGTETGTNPVVTVVDEGISSVRSLYAWQDMLFFEADSGSGDQLFVYDPVLDTVKDLSMLAGQASENHDPSDYVPYNGYLYYRGEDGNDTNGHLFRTAGNSIEQLDSTIKDIDDMVLLNDTLYFEAEEDGVTGNELFSWSTAILQAILPDTVSTCAGDSVGIMATGAPGPAWTYTWFADEMGMMPLDTTETYVVSPATASDTFYVRIDSANVQGRIVSTVLEVNTDLAGGASIVPVTGTDSLIAQPNGTGYSFQWLDAAGDPIAGATDSVYIPASSGDYAVLISSGDCADTSAAVNFILVGVEDELLGGFQLFPNPTVGQLSLRWTQPLDAPVQVTLLDLMGRRLHSEALPRGRTQLELDLTAQPAGTYLLRFEGEAGSVVRRVVKE